MKKVAILDYGMGNIQSVARAFEKCGTSVSLISKITNIDQIDYLVLPGVGAFAVAMENLKASGLLDGIYEFTKTSRPFLGICLGMQLMLEESEEFGINTGLGLIKGKVKSIPKENDKHQPIKIPHIGWNKIQSSHSNCTLLKSFTTNPYMYFVHSFSAHTENPEETAATTHYNEVTITAMVSKNNLYGCQFHPEKSGPDGLKLLSEFIAL